MKVYLSHHQHLNDHVAIVGDERQYYHIRINEQQISIWTGDHYGEIWVSRQGDTWFDPICYELIGGADEAFARLLADPAAFIMELIL